MNCKNKSKQILIFSLVIALNISIMPCYAKKAKQEQEKQFTGAQEIGSDKLNIVKDRTYDEAITIKEVNVQGNKLIKADKILQELNNKPGIRFDRDLIQEDLKQIYKMGFFTEKLKAVPQAGTNGIILHIQVEENVPVAGFTVTGNEAIPSNEIINIVNPQAGLPQNINELNKAVKEIEKLYADKGYVLARVKKISDDPDGNINIDINEGIIDELVIQGNTKTKNFVIKRNLTIKPGEVYNEQKLKKDLARIFGTQAFSDVRRIITASPKDPDKYRLAIEVDEKRTGSISLGGGIDSESGLFGQVGYMDNNFLGNGQELSTNFLVGSGVMFDDRDIIKKSPLQFEAKFVEPRLFQSMNSLEVLAFARDMASYQVPLSIERRIGSQIEIARPIKGHPNLAGSISMGVENIKLSEGDENEIKNLFNQKGLNIAERAKQLQGGTFISVGPSLVYDTRDNLLNPRSGLYASAGVKESFSIQGDTKTFGKISASINKYFPVGKESSFSLSAKAGSKVVGALPEFAAFRLGGSNSIRGFHEGDVGTGQTFSMATAEFRTPVPYLDRLLPKQKFFKNVRLAFFMDAGKIFDQTLTDSLYDYPGYAISVGTGILLPLPYIGPLRFDYGYPLTRVGKGNKKGMFTFGIGERY